MPPKSAYAACWEGGPLKRQTIQTGLPLPPCILLSPSCGEHLYAADTPGTENTHCPPAGCAIWTQLSAKSSSRQPHPWMDFWCVAASNGQVQWGHRRNCEVTNAAEAPQWWGRGCVGTALQLSFAICPILLSHCPVTKVDTSYINPSQHLLSQRFVRSGTGSGNERDLHFSSAGWQPGCPLLGQEQHPKPPHVQVQVLFSVLAQSQATT